MIYQKRCSSNSYDQTYDVEDQIRQGIKPTKVKSQPNLFFSKPGRFTSHQVTPLLSFTH
jgi:hypothetical protein